MRGKAIDTVYRGHKFRSRHEARYAVLFDILGIPFHYELQGYELDGVRYLPDFWLSDQECWVKVKVSQPNTEECEKARLLAQFTQKSVFVVWGDLQPYYMERTEELDSETIWMETGIMTPLNVFKKHGICGHRFEPRGENEEAYWSDTFWFLTECPKCSRIKFAFLGYISTLSCGCMKDENLSTNDEEQDMHDSPRLTIAYTIANEARFEFGEKGHPKNWEDVV